MKTATKYFLVADLGYDGLMVTEYDNEKEALSEYAEKSKTTPKYCDGVALIKGIVIKSRELEFTK
jgi:hypothetical protein